METGLPFVKKPLRPLSWQHEKFCRRYVFHREGKRAYIEAFGPPKSGEKYAEKAASRFLRVKAIKARIRELTDAQQLTNLSTVQDVVGRFTAIATADPRDLINLRVGCCRYCYGSGHAYQWREREYAEELTKWEKLLTKNPEAPIPDIAGGFGFKSWLPPHPTCEECGGEGVPRVVPTDTTNLDPHQAVLYGGVKVTKTGYEIIMADQQKAMENVARILGMFKDNVNLSGQITSMEAIVNLPANTTPEAAAEAYQKMIAGMSMK